MTSRFSHDGICFAYRAVGSGPLFVFQHGLGGDVGQVSALASSGVRLVTLECRGHGETDPLGPLEALTFETFARDLDALLRSLDVERCVLGGVSMGAALALATARLRPERVLGLVLVRPAWAVAGPSPNLEPFRLVARLLQEHGTRDGPAHLVRSSLYQSVARRSSSAARSLLGQFHRRNAVERAPVLERLTEDRPINPAELPLLSMPSLVIAAGSDPVHPITHAVELQQHLPDASLDVVRAKDLGEVEHRRAVERETAAFVRKIVLSGGSGLA